MILWPGVRTTWGTVFKGHSVRKAENCYYRCNMTVSIPFLLREPGVAPVCLLLLFLHSFHLWHGEKAGKKIKNKEQETKSK